MEILKKIIENLFIQRLKIKKIYKKLKLFDENINEKIITINMFRDNDITHIR